MFKINKLRVEILTNQSKDIADLYGFEILLKQGLNIIAGPNSRGKTTINTCIYYALGMEELLGGHNEKALDKSLKEEFTIKWSEEEESINYEVLSSKVFLEIENENHEIISLERFIKAEVDNEKTSNIIVHYASIEDVKDSEKNTSKGIFFVNSRGDNDDPNGFYNWLSNFINIHLPQVANSSRSSNYSPLYLQTVFSALFIEQTKGWSDFFATMPYFGITKAKEKIIEFILGLNEIELSTQKDVLIKKKSILIDEWKRIIKSFAYLEKQTNSEIVNIPEELTSDKVEINKINVLFTTGEDNKIDLNEFLTQKTNSIRELENKPISTIKENREVVLIEFNKQKQEYFKLNDYIEIFETKLRIEQKQLTDLTKQLATVESEIKDHINLQKVFKKNIINELGANHCPTCFQEVTVNLISTRNIKIPQLTLKENTNFLRSQRKLILLSIDSLRKTVDEKEILLRYFKNTLRKKEVLIKSLSNDLISDDRAFSESDVVKKLQLERDIESIQLLKNSVADLKKELEKLANEFHNNNIAIRNLNKSEKEDELKLLDFETQYKTYLFEFGYDSNEKYQISVNRKEPFKYLPIYINKKEGVILPQSIRINSSASDFVRNIWAYTLSLLKNGINHPGIVIFDEPGQHRTKLSSLKELFNAASRIKKRQTIIFTSVDGPLYNEEDEKIDLDILIENIESKNYNLTTLDKVHKIIGKLPV